MSKLSHSNDETMDKIERDRAIENGDEDLIPSPSPDATGRDIVERLEAEIPAWPFIGKIMQSAVNEIQSLRAQLAESVKSVGYLQMKVTERGEQLAEKEKGWKIYFETYQELKAKSDCESQLLQDAHKMVFNLEKRNIELEQQLEAIRKQTVETLEQIYTVCRDNDAVTCNHKMALDFVWQISCVALDALSTTTAEEESTTTDTVKVVLDKNYKIISCNDPNVAAEFSSAPKDGERG